MGRTTKILEGHMNIFLPASEAQLRVHGNGFLQAETKEGKMHVWDTRLPHQSVSTNMHNHNHGFSSEIVHGALHIVEWNLCAPNRRDEVYVPHTAIPREGKDTRLEPSAEPVSLTNRRSFLFQTGSKYTHPFNMHLFHDVIPIWSEKLMTITLITRMNYTSPIEPTVLVPIGLEPDNAFNRYAFQDIAETVYEDAVDLLS